MKIETICPVCARYDEDGGDLFFKCKIVRHAWALLNLEEDRRNMAEMRSAKEVTEYILKAIEKKNLMIVFTLWSWWSERNNIREVKTRSQQQAEEFRDGQNLNRGSVLKLNCDACFLPETKAGGWGFIIRDCDGDVVHAGRGRVDSLLDAFRAEVIACLQGVQMAIDLGISSVVSTKKVPYATLTWCT
ncbi:hypothetical protein EJB05_25849, partial [Eragrostis curvula]